jgi:hypothetical protein
VEFLNRKLPDFLEYVCRRHNIIPLYRTLLPGLLNSLAQARALSYSFKSIEAEVEQGYNKKRKHAS